MLKCTVHTACLLTLAGCSGYQPMPGLQSTQRAIIDASAAGWNVNVGSQGQTILVNPQLRTFDIGHTQCPDIAPAHLGKRVVEELGAEFLVLYVPPVASGGSTMTLFTVLRGDVPVRAADIRTHRESAEEALVFRDSDADGMPELVEDDAYRWKGHKTYYRFDGRRFQPLWIEYYRAPDDDDYNLQLVARHRAK